MDYFDCVGTTYYKGGMASMLTAKERQDYINRTAVLIKRVFAERIEDIGCFSVASEPAAAWCDEIPVDWTVCIKAANDDEICNAIDESNTEPDFNSFLHEAYNVTEDIMGQIAIRDAEIIYAPEIEDCVEQDGSVSAVDVWDGFGEFADIRSALMECYRLAIEALQNSRYSIAEGHFHAVSLACYVMRDGQRVIDHVKDIVPNVEHERSIANV